MWLSQSHLAFAEVALLAVLIYVDKDKMLKTSQLVIRDSLVLGIESSRYHSIDAGLLGTWDTLWISVMKKID